MVWECGEEGILPEYWRGNVLKKSRCDEDEIISLTLILKIRL